MIQDIADPLWMLGDTLTPAFEALQLADLTFDALTLPEHLKPLKTLLARHPDMRVVIDHGSKPLIKDAIIRDWADDMAVLAREPTPGASSLVLSPRQTRIGHLKICVPMWIICSTALARPV